MSNKTRVSGIVERILQRTTSAGITYALVVDNVQYGFFKTDPKCAEGDYVEFSASTSANGQYWNADAKTLQVKPATTKTIPTPNYNPAPSKWVPDDKRQDTISYQAARKDALELVGILLNAGVLDLGKSKTTTGKIDVVETYIDKYTMRFFEDTKNLGHKTEAEPMSESPDKSFVEDDIPF